MVRLELNLLRATRMVDGAPDVAGLPCDRIEDGEAADYMRRYHLRYGRRQGIRFHHILGSDPGPWLHDHPWDFVSVLIQGGYTEITEQGQVRYDAPCVIQRKAETPHRLIVDHPVWTYVVTGRLRRTWGFHAAGGWVRHDQAGAQPVKPCTPFVADRWLGWHPWKRSSQILPRPRCC